MSDNLKVEESFVEALLEQAAWTAASIEVSERKTAKKESTRPGTPGNSTADLDLSDDEPEEDEEDEDSVGRMGNHDEMKEKKVKEKKVKEATEEHTCPLCESTLDEELTDDQIQEHVSQIQAALLSIEEGGEPSDADLDAIEAEDDAPSNDDDLDEKKKKKKAAVMKKVKELKSSSKGK